MEFSEKVGVQKQRINGANPESKERDNGVFYRLTLYDAHV
jgi:hypothetical protein